ncbi:MAG: tetratricopeptide repeat protein [Aureispira sp.]
MSRSLLYILFLVYSGSLTAQVQLTTPLEMLTFMEASPTTYEFEQLYGTPPRKKRTILPHGAYLTNIDGKEHQAVYQSAYSKEEQVFLTIATDWLNTEQPAYPKVRRLYQKLLKAHPKDASLHTLIGTTYYEEEQWANAQRWFDKALALNPIDYKARWLLGELFLQQEQLDTALYTLTMAHLFNRNHPRLLTRLIEVYDLARKPYYRNWGFDPLMHVYKDGETVVVSADGIWLTYGLYKAVWQYDTDYQYIKAQQSISDYLFQQEMEAAIGTYMTYTELKEDDPRNYPAMNAFGLCLDRALVEEFVFYEILLVDRPALAYHLTPDFMQRLMHYISSVRGMDYVIDED